MPAGTAPGRCSIGGGTVGPRGHAPRHQAVSHAEHSRVVIAEIRVRCGKSAKPLEGSALWPVNFHPSGGSKYVKFARHISKRLRLQSNISNPDANSKTT
jgi:hypothetical protein